MGRKKYTIPIAFTLFFLFTSNIASAEIPSGYYFESYDGYQFRYGHIPNMSYLYNHTFYCNPDNNPVLDTNETAIRLNPDNSYTFKNITKFSSTYGGTVNFENVTLYFEGNGTGTQGGFISGPWKISDALIISNDTAINFAAQNIENYDLHNITFKKVNSYTLNGGVYYGNVDNISFYDSTNGLLINNKVGGYVKDIYLQNMTRQSFLCENGTYTAIDNITIEKGGDYLNPKTYVAFIVAGGHDNKVTNISVDGSPWSGVDLTANEFNTTLENIHVDHSGHNGIDFHGQWNCSINNATVNGSVAENFLIAGPDASYQPDYSLINWTPIKDNRVTHNITIRNYNSYNSTGCALSANRLMNLFVENLTSDNKGGGILINYAMGVKILNAQISNNTGGGITLGLGGRGVVKDVSVMDSSFNTYAWMIETQNVNFINNIVPEYRFQTGNTAEYKVSYHADFLAADSKGNPISNSTVLIVTNNTTFLSTNGFGDNKTKFNTQNNGHTALPNENRENSPAITEYYKNYPEGKYLRLSHTVTITTLDNRTVSLSGITPDSSWYRPDPNVPTYTITAIIPNTSSTGPQIIGFAPSRDNPFNPGEKKNFRVWTDEPLTIMEWFVNGSPVHNGSLNYTWNVTDRNTTIEFIGSNANGTVKHIWPLGESHDEPSVPDDNPTQEIQFSPADSEITLKVNEKTIFGVSPDIFTTKEWYINGCLIQNNTASMTRCWSTAGTRDVTFKGTRNGEPVSHTWTVNVVEEQKNQNESIIKVDPEYQIIEPKKPFNLSIKIEPETSITGTQLDFAFNSPMASVVNVTEGDLLKQSGAYTIFSSGTINNSAGTVKNIYGFILGTSNVSSPGTMATVNLTAGNNTGMAKFSLTNVIISDENSKSVPYTVTNATVLIDTAPVITPIGSKSVNEKSTLAFKVSARDADGDRLILSASGVPQSAVFNTTSGNFTWTPERGQAGVYTITFKISDGYLTDSQSVTVTVNRLNNPPVISSFEPLNGSSFSEGERIGISVNASDAEGQALNYSIRIDGVEYITGEEYVWETDYSSSGNHTIEVAVSDGIDDVKAQRTVFINDCHPRWDVNEDGVVNILDITMVSQTYGTTVNKPYPRHDVNQDGVVNILDLTLVGNHFGEYVN